MLLEKAFERGCISYIDLSLAKYLSNKDDDVAFFLAHLSLSSRFGHLCVEVNDGKIYPDPKNLWFEHNQIKTDVEVLDKIFSGAKKISKSIFEEVSEGQLTFPGMPICKFQNYYYFQKNYLFESIFLKHLKRVVDTKPKITIEPKILDKKLNPEQKQAIEHVCQNSFTILLGGPGTGKTYTVGALVNALLDATSQNIKIVIAAPTGKAAIRLQNSLKCDQNEIQAKTLHSLLSMKDTFSVFDEVRNKIDADVIIVDESSMMDVKMAANLLNGVKNGSRLVLIGDQNQLSPVEAGSVFKDTAHALKDQYVELKRVIRTDDDRINELAKFVKEGDQEQVLKMMKLKKVDNDFIEDAFSLFPKNYQKDPLNLLEEYEKVRLLSPLRKGPFGVNSINKRFFEKVYASCKSGDNFVVPIMITKNDYQLNLFNGDTGLLFIKKNESFYDLEPIQAYFYDPENREKIRKISASMLPNYEYAFCISIHKSQGSEYDRVLIILPDGSEVFGREVLYTAVTRAKKAVVVAAKESTIKKILQRKTDRLSAVQFRLLAIPTQK